MAAQALPIEVMDGAAQMGLGRRVVIASLFPIEKKVRRNYQTKEGGGYLTEYVVPACASSEPTTLVVGDAFEYVYMGGGRYQRIPVPGGAKAVADDVINAVRTNSFGATSDPMACPAIWICANLSGPTEEEKAYWLAAQETYFRNLVAEADKIYFQGKSGQQPDGTIGSLHRTAGSWLQFDPRQHEWMVSEKKGNLKACQFCSSDIDSAAVKCPRCNEIVDAIRYKQLKAMAEPEPAPATLVVAAAPTEPQRAVPGIPIPSKR